MLESVEGSRGICEDADGAVGLPKMTRLGSRKHLCNALFVPVCRPVVTVVDAEGEPAGPASYARQLPSPDQPVGDPSALAAKALAFAEGQFDYPVGVQLVRGVKIRNRSAPIGIEGIGQAGSRRSDIHTRTPAQAGRRRGDVD